MGLLKTEVVGNELIISLDMEALKCSLESGRLDMIVGGEFKITNMDEFLPEFKRFLMQEEEDGSTPIHIMFDEVAANMLENTDAGCSVEE